jgi:hypothetical protein
MKIEESHVTKLLLTELDGLDPVTVIVENYEPGKGRIIIECYGKTWSNYWGGMSNMTLENFFRTAGLDYLVEKLAPEIEGSVLDEGQALIDAAKAQVQELRDYGDIDDEEVYELNRRIDDYLWDGINESDNRELLYKLFGDDWWIHLPETTNHEYAYICRIVEAVKAAFEKQAEQEALRAP